jgi:hypothetical protein
VLSVEAWNLSSAYMGVCCIGLPDDRTIYVSGHWWSLLKSAVWQPRADDADKRLHHQKLNKTGNALINITLRRVHVTIVAVEKQ